MSDMVDKLRRLADDKALPIGKAWNALDEAADHIEQLEGDTLRSGQSDAIPQWIFIDSQTSEAICNRCGQRERPPLPAPITSFMKWCEYFGDRHKFCREKEG